MAWRAVSVVVAMSILGMAACGQDDGEQRSKAAASKAAARGELPDPDREIPDPALASSGDVAQIQEVVDDYQDGLLTLSGWSVCREIARSAVRAVAGGRNCIAAVDELLGKAPYRRMRRVRVKVVALDADRARGTADATIARPGGPRFHLRLRYEVGWKISTVDLDDPTGLPAD